MNALTENGATFMGAVITHWDDLRISQDFERVHLPRELREYGGQAFTAKIPIDNQLESLEPGAKTNGAKAYEALAVEVMHAVEEGLEFEQ